MRFLSLQAFTVPHILSNFKTFLNTFIVFGLALNGVLVVGKHMTNSFAYEWLKTQVVLGQ